MLDSDVYAGLEPRELWRHFAALNAIPRPSGQEAAAREYVRQVAEAAGATSAVDAAGNMVVRMPARGVAAAPAVAAPAVAVQAHLDMVCEQRPEVSHDFATDPIRPRRDGDRIYGTGTTLGADNGIGAAAALALLTEPGLEHGPLELIFTVEEETGLHGAMALDPSLLKARMLINLDSEDPDELTIGCAGGAGVNLRFPVTREATPAGWVGREIIVSGLKGGHSGVQIHENLANAIKLLIGGLLYVQDVGCDFRFASLDGGNARNAIPRDATARLAVAPVAVATLERTLANFQEALHGQWGDDEPDLAVTVREVAVPEQVMSQRAGSRLLHLLDDIPHGVVTMSEVFKGKVETSSNLAEVRTGDDAVEIATSNRSFIGAELEKLQGRIKALGEAAGATAELRDGYPGWEPDPGSRLLQTADVVFRHTLGKAPNVQVIHAGLECGVIVAKVPGMEAISFGPLIKSAHTPEEHLFISSVRPIWELLTALLRALARQTSVES